LNDEEPLIRAHVVWALGELSGSEALPIIREKLKNEREAIVLEELGRLSNRFV
jgi:hypothetical protein